MFTVVGHLCGGKLALDLSYDPPLMLGRVFETLCHTCAPESCCSFILARDGRARYLWHGHVRRDLHRF